VIAGATPVLRAVLVGPEAVGAKRERENHLP
jgi:hypothetical protein